MKVKQLQMLFGVLVVLLLVYFATRPKKIESNIEELVQTIVIGVAQDDVAGIEVYKETGAEEPVRMQFVKQGDQWHIATNHFCKAQKSQIDRLLKDVIAMTGKVRSDDPGHFEKYKISDRDGLHLLIKDKADKVMANLIIGKKPEDSESSFIRYADQEKVYFADKNLLSGLGIYGDVDTLTQFNTRRFVDLQAVKMEKDNLKAIRVGSREKGKEITIRKVEREEEVTKDSVTTTEKKDVWVLVEKKGKQEKEIDLDQKEVDNFINAVKSIYASEVVDRIGNSFADVKKQSKYGLGNFKHYIAFKVAGEDQEKNVVIGKKYGDDEGNYMLVQYDGLVYKVTKYNVDKIVKWIDDLPEKTKQD